MGILSKLFGGDDEQAPQPKDEKWQVDQPAQTTDASGTFNDRYQACPDCDGIYLCSAHLAEMKTLLAQDTTEQPPAPQPRRWLW